MAFLRRWVAWSLVLVVAIALPGCSLSQFKTQTARVPQYVDTLLSAPKTFNSTQSKEANNVFGLIYEGLTTQNGLTGEIEPALAESWEFSADKLKIIFTLRPNLKWSDGTPLTADDVVFSYNDVYLNEAIPTDTRDVLRVGKNRALPKVRKLDDQRVEFSIPEPFAPFLRTAGAISILPAHALKKLVDTPDSKGNPQFISAWGVDTDPKEIIVNGPYQLERYETNQRVVFRRNPNYWRYQIPGRANGNIERIIWKIVESPDTALLQFRTGGLDSVGVRASTFSLLKREEKSGNFTIYEGGPDFGTTFVFFNLNRGRRNNKPLVNPIKSRWFNNVKFRQAVAYAIDRERILANTYQGLGLTQNSPISVQSPYYLPPEEGLKVYDYDLQKSKQLLQDAGFKTNKQGQLLDDQGNKVRFTLMAPAGSTLGAQIKQDLSKVGMKVDYTPIAFNTMVDKLDDSLDWDCALLGLTGSLEPNTGANVWSPEGGLHMFNQKPQPPSEPIQGFTVSDWEQEIADLYIEGAQELDEAKRKAIYAKTQQIAQEHLPFIYLINPLALAAVRNNFEGTQYTALGKVTWNIHDIRDVGE
ncbi:ABC transporter substrate-binding protein [Acaryochloris marina]|uniref:Oligopeptide ABC transporter, periplasmic oligopeptide-binding protein, putative n=1 Tax=Acaryochloris marina (strain MBIC 11017) TaxID=329726 RepID=B0BYT3_ACAM1|nr:ABC transporter substrate-binding protein [Acaryochloris marina]ABW27099.1 oligopeptide ABC transporter, periplasmic oligopeptide-binding protein, putative [Acaryochloris marina MBIC11017]